MPAGITTTYDYDAAGRLVNLWHQGPHWRLAAYTYTLDAIGNRIAVMERLHGHTPHRRLPLVMNDFDGSEMMMGAPSGGQLPEALASPLATPIPREEV